MSDAPLRTGPGPVDVTMQHGAAWMRRAETELSC